MLLTTTESRVLGVVIEKALTVPNQYPLSLNSIVDGANQKNNRDPILDLTEDQTFDALETLRHKQLIVRVDQVGARVPKYKHAAIETLKVRTAEAAILAELLLRGPQTLGELRSRASRMSPLESLDRVRDMIRALRDRPEPYVQELAPSPGSRSELYVQLLCPDLHAVPSASFSSQRSESSGSQPADDALVARVTRLERELAETRQVLAALATALGQANPFTSS